MIKSHIIAANIHAHLEILDVQSTLMKKDRGKVLQPYKQCTHAKVCVACEGVLPSIGHYDFW